MWVGGCLRVCVLACVRACVRAWCVRACVRDKKVNAILLHRFAFGAALYKNYTFYDDDRR